MAFQPATDVAMAELKFGAGTWYWQNNLNFEKNGFNLADMQALATEIQDTYAASALKARMYNLSNMYEVVVTDMRTEGAEQFVLSTAGCGGGSAVDPVAPGAACVVTFRTALRGRSYRGRCYWAGLTEAQMTAGEYIAAAVTDLESFFTDLLAAVAVLGWTFVVVTRQHNGVIPASATGNTVTEINVRSERPGSQRRRNLRG